MSPRENMLQMQMLADKLDESSSFLSSKYHMICSVQQTKMHTKLIVIHDTS